MKKIPGHYSRLALWVLLMVLLAACGSQTTLTSSASPSVFYSHSVAFRNHTTFSWGANTYGQLGNGDNTGATQLSPIKVLITPIVDGISAGGTHTLAFKNNSSAYAWGNNGDGQLGNNTQTSNALPVQVLMRVPGSNPVVIGHLTKVTAVAAGGNHSLAIVNTGADSTTAVVWAWGGNYAGQVGDTTLTTRLAAVPVQDPINGALTLVGIKKISAGGSHSLALRSNGTVSSWGYNGLGQLGNKFRPSFQNISSLNRAYPDQVVDTSGNTIQNVVDIAAGGSHSLFLDVDGNVWACGYNAFGQLGVGDTTDRNLGVVPVDLSAVSGVPIQVAAGLDHSLLLTDNGLVWAWGYNFSGQLGNGAALASNTPVTRPVPVLMGPSPGTPLINIVKIVAIGNHSLAVDSSGQLWAWGDNTFGQLGNGTSTSSSFAKKVNKLTTNSDLYHP